MWVGYVMLQPVVYQASKLYTHSYRKSIEVVDRQSRLVTVGGNEKAVLRGKDGLKAALGAWSFSLAGVEVTLLAGTEKDTQKIFVC